jgi:hypothetical protein
LAARSAARRAGSFAQCGDGQDHRQNDQQGKNGKDAFFHVGLSLLIFIANSQLAIKNVFMAPVGRA